MNPAFESINLYNALNVSPNATAEEIKKARNRCALKQHSDKGGNDDMMKIINEANRVLSDPKLRREYDNTRCDRNEEPDTCAPEAAGFFHVGRKLSEDYVSKINAWKKMHHPCYGEKPFVDPNAAENNGISFLATPACAAYCNLVNRHVPSIETSLSLVLTKDLWNWSHHTFSLIDKRILNAPIWTAELKPVQPTPVHSLQMVDFSGLNAKSGHFAFPSIRGLMQAITEHSQTVSSPLFSSSARQRPGTAVPLCPNTKQMQAALGHIPTYTVPHSSVVLQQDAMQCSDCQKPFGLFLWSSNCMLCGNASCSDCLNMKNVPDYLDSVPIGRCCEPDIKKIHQSSWVKPLEDPRVRQKVTANYLALVDALGFGNRAQFLQWSALFFDQGRYDLAIQCHFSGNGDWKILALKFLQKGQWSDAKTCLDQMPQKEAAWWIREGDAVATVHPALAHLFYQKGELPPEDYTGKALQFADHLISDSCIIAFAKSKRIDLLHSTCQLAIQYKKHRLALLCAEQGQFKQEKWIEMINRVEVSEAEQYVQHMDRTLSCNWQHIRLKPDRDHLRWPHLGAAKFDVWLEYLVQSLKSGNGDSSIPYFRSKMRDENFMVHRDRFLEQAEYTKMAICHRLIPNAISWEDLAQKWRKKSEAAALACYLCSSEDLSKTADRLFAIGDVSLALRCYLHAGNDKAIKERVKNLDYTTTLKHKGMYQNDDYKTCLLYKLALWKKNPRAEDLALDLCHTLITQAANQQAVRNITIATCQSLSAAAAKESESLSFSRSSSRRNSLDAMPFRLRLLAKSGISNCELLGILEYFFNNPAINQCHTSWREETLLSFQNTFKALLRHAIYHNSFKDLFPLVDLIHPLTRPVVDALLKEFKFDQLARGPLKSICLMVKALYQLSFPNGSDLLAAMHGLTEALVGHPTEECLAFGSKVLEKISAHTQQKGILQVKGMAHLQPPVENEFTDRLVRTPDLRMLIRSEEAIAEFKPFDAAMSYIDVCMAVSSAPGIVGGFLNAALALVKAQKNPTLSRNENYAYRRAIVDLVVTAYTIGNARFCPATQLYTLKAGIAILTSAFKQSQTISASDQMVLDALSEEAHKLSKVFPMAMERMVKAYDLIYVDLIYREFMTSHLDKMRNSSQQTNPIYQYYLFEGTWKGWVDAEKFSFEEERKRTMQALLNEKGHTESDVEALMNWPALNRDANGWLLNTTTPLNLPGHTFSQVEGIRFNLETGEIDLLLNGNDNPMDALFNMDDVADVMQLGVAGAQFTLDPPDANMPDHPFQEMLYAPSALSRTPYLATMLHADLLLKMLSMRTEISSIPPFALRGSEEGLLKRLPEWLSKKFSKLNKKLPDTAGKIHRFWIEAGDLPYFTTQSGNVITYRFGTCTMAVKKHRMVRDRDGKLVDTDRDDDTTSSEAKFAKLMTDKYEVLGTYFRELARLKELVKLQALSAIAQDRYQKMQEISASLCIPKKAIKAKLNHLRGLIDYPHTQKVEELVSECLRKNRVSRHEVSYSELQKLKNTFYEQCQKADASCVAQIEGILSKQYHTQSLHREIMQWLDHGRQSDLVSGLKKAGEQYEREKILRICKTFKRIGIATELQPGPEGKACAWVPAAFGKTDSYRVYGGVNMTGRLVHGGSSSPPPARGGPIGPGTGTGYQHVVRMEASGRIHGTTTCVDRVTGNTYTAAHLGTTVQDQWYKNKADMEYFWKTRVGYTTTEHYSHHSKTNTAHVHDVGGQYADCIDAQGKRTTYDKYKGKHSCNK